MHKAVTQPAATRVRTSETSDRSLVLVVDDNELNREVAVQLLWALGLEAHAVSTGQEAIDYCEHHCPAAVLMDLSMPGIDGLEATRRIRTHEQVNSKKRVPIIAATASFEFASPRQCAEVGMDGFLPKPLYLPTLRKELISRVSYMHELVGA